jgi:alpha-tubulin suppressor-like RCC1 family protein
MPEEAKKVDYEYISDIESISFGVDHSLMLDKKNRVFSCGFNRYGRLGHGDEIDRPRFTFVKTFKDKKVIEVKCGHYHSLALTKDGHIYTWGYGSYGRLG